MKPGYTGRVANPPVARKSGSSAGLAAAMLKALVPSVLMLCGGCGALSGLVLPGESTDPVDTTRFELLARVVHLSDAHMVDEESPGRLTAAAALTRSAWRPYEAYSTQLLDGMVRTINKIHVARHTIDFVVFTGDTTDNAQANELRWFITAFDGGRIQPRTGPDDRDPSSLPDALLDPHHAFDAQGLYRRGVHGDAPTIGWYGTLGNHDRFAVGVLPIVTDFSGRRVSPLPLENRIGLFLPVILDPTGSLAWAPITPANPGPPPDINLPMIVEPNPERRFITDRDFVEAHLQSTSEPPGHGFDAESPGRTWYSVSPLPGLRLITLNSATPLLDQPTLIYHEGAISFPQLLFLRRELKNAQARNECVIVATHHPSDALTAVYGTALMPRSFRRLLNEYSCVKLHIAGHWHRNVVYDRGGYVEIVTSSIIDAPQLGRVIEIWRRTQIEPHASARADDGESGDGIELRYWGFSHLAEIDPPDDSHADLFHDPLLPMRRVAAELAGALSEVASPP